MIRLAQPEIGEAEVAAVAEVLRTGFLVQGERVRRFEQALAERVGMAHAVAVANCTAALHLSLLALGIGDGDEVAVPAYSWPATANAVVLAGAEPVFVDIDAHLWAMDPAGLAEVLQRRPMVRAVLPVHPFGSMADLPALLKETDARGLPVIEDAACAIGAKLGGRPAGSWGRLSCFSFHPRKIVTTGEGGMVTTNDRELARRVRMLRNHGLDPDSPTPEFVAAGFNLRLTEFQGALGLVQLGRLQAMLATRRRIAAWYAERLSGQGLVLPAARDPEAHVYQAYVVLLPSEAAPLRAGIIDRLREAGVETTIGTHHIPLTRFYRERGGYTPGQFSVTDSVAARALTLPMHGGLDRPQVDRVADLLLAELASLDSGVRRA